MCVRPHSGKSAGGLGLCVHATSTQDEFPANVRADATPPASGISDCHRGVLLPDSVTLHHDSASLIQSSNPQSLRANQLRYPRKNTASEEILAVAAMLVLFSAGMLLPFILSGCLLATTLCRSIPAMLFLAATALDCCLPAGKMWPAFRNCFVMDVLRRHYRVRIVTPPHPFMDVTKHHLCVQFPHSVFPLSCFLNPALVGAPGSGMPGPMEGVVASILLQIPFIKHIFGWIGAHPADARTIRQLLKRTSIGMQPEGIAGVFHGARPDREAVYLKQRKGFVKVAIQAGTDIMPVYHLGDSQLFHFWGLNALSRKLRASLGFVWGRWGLPLPMQHDLISAISYPIRVKQCDNPAPEEVDRVHALVVAAVIRLYEDHKHLIPGWDSRPLHII